MPTNYVVEVSPAVKYTKEHFIQKDASYYFLINLDEVIEYFTAAYLRGGFISDESLVDDYGESYFKEELWDDLCDYWMDYLTGCLESELEDIDIIGLSYVKELDYFLDLEDRDNPKFLSAHVVVTI